MDPYRLLGVSPGCTLEELKRAYRVKARQAHPDLGGSEPAFIDVCEAYRKVLQEIALRKASVGSKPVHSQGPGSASRASERGTRTNRRASPQGESRRQTPRPADPLWDPDLILMDHPVWVGHPGRPPDPDWEPELILLDEEAEGLEGSPAEQGVPDVSDVSFPWRTSPPARSARGKRELSSRELVLGIVIFLGMIAIAVGAFLRIVWQGGTQPGP